jgi:hypothetical protein
MVASPSVGLPRIGEPLIARGVGILGRLLGRGQPSTAPTAQRAVRRAPTCPRENLHNLRHWTVKQALYVLDCECCQAPLDRQWHCVSAHRCAGQPYLAEDAEMVPREGRGALHPAARARTPTAAALPASHGQAARRLRRPFRPAAMTAAPTASTALRCGSSNRWAYLCVVVGLLCPSNAPTNCRLAPSETSCEANEWRRSWMRSPEIFAVLHIARHARLTLTTCSVLPGAGKHIFAERLALAGLRLADLAEQLPRRRR